MAELTTAPPPAPSAPDTAPPPDVPQEPAARDVRLVLEDLVVEEVSIDGMCGVY